MNLRAVLLFIGACFTYAILEIAFLAAVAGRVLSQRAMIAEGARLRRAAYTVMEPTGKAGGSVSKAKPI